jgi:hypothetical protein
MGRMVTCPWWRPMPWSREMRSASATRIFYQTWWYKQGIFRFLAVKNRRFVSVIFMLLGVDGGIWLQMRFFGWTKTLDFFWWGFQLINGDLFPMSPPVSRGGTGNSTQELGMQQTLILAS